MRTIRLVVMLPGATTPKTNCVILPSAPVGVVSVSPVARHATMAMKKLITTQRRLIHQAIPKSFQAKNITSGVSPEMPYTNHWMGTSTAAMGSSLTGFALEKIPERPEKARAICRQENANESKPEVRSSGEPNHTVHWEIARILTSAISWMSKPCGASAK